MARYYGSIDIGTTRIKARLYDEEFNLSYSRDLENRTYTMPGGVAEQDPLFIVDSVKSLLSDLLARGAASIGVATYRGSLIVWDGEGSPVTNIITWMDTRSRRLYKSLPLNVRLAARLPRIGNALSPESMAVRLAILVRERSDVARGLNAGSLYAWNIDAYIAFKIIGRYSSDAGNAALTGLIHPKTLKPIKPILNLIGLRKMRLPEILCHDEVIGYLKGASFGPSMGDQQASSIALGCIDEGCLRISLGTGLFLGYTTGERLYLKSGYIPLIVYCSRHRRVYGLELYVPGLGRMVEWLVNTTLGGDYRLFNENVKNDYRGPIIVPFIWGLRRPRIKELSSGIIGIDGIHSASDLVNSLAHSIAAITTLLFKELTRIGKPKRIIITGGLARMNNLVKLIASYIERPVQVSRRADDSAIGAALAAANSVGFNPSYRPDTYTIEPDPSVSRVDPELIVDTARLIEGLIWRSMAKRSHY